MSRATETRLGKLEVRAGVAGRRVFIFGAVEPGKAKRRELIASGEATEDDFFAHADRVNVRHLPRRDRT